MTYRDLVMAGAQLPSLAQVIQMAGMTAGQRRERADQREAAKLGMEAARRKAEIEDRRLSLQERSASQEEQQFSQKLADQEAQKKANMARYGQRMLQSNPERAQEVIQWMKGQGLDIPEAGPMPTQEGPPPPASVEDVQRSLGMQAASVLGTEGPQGPQSTIGKELIDRGFVMGTPEWNAEYDRRMVSSEEGQKSLTELGRTLTELGMTPGTPEYQQKYEELWNEQRNAAAAEMKADQAKDAMSGVDALRRELQATPSYRKSLALKEVWEKAMVTGEGGPSDIALITLFMKAQDPNSQVTGGEFESAEVSGGMLKKINGLYEKLVSGGKLDETQRAEFRDLIKRQYLATLKISGPIRKKYRGIAESRGWDASQVDILYDSDANEAPPARQRPQKKPKSVDAAVEQIAKKRGLRTASGGKRTEKQEMIQGEIKKLMPGIDSFIDDLGLE